jgi:hypothetical protein
MYIKSKYISMYTYTYGFCVHYLCLTGWVYVFYVGHIDEKDYRTLRHVVIFLSKHHYHHRLIKHQHPSQSRRELDSEKSFSPKNFSEKNEFSPNNRQSPKTVLESRTEDDVDEDDDDDGDGDGGDDTETFFKSESVLFERTVLMDTKKKTVYLFMYIYKQVYRISFL